MNALPGLELPAYFSYYEAPVKMVSTPDGGLAAWRLNRESGGWKPANDIVGEILLAIGGDISVLTPDRFVQRTEFERAVYLKGEGPIFALYETVRAIEDTAEAECRDLTTQEQALIRGIRRRTFVMFEEELQRAGDPGADPTIATGQA
ncbi:hypothetical protein [Micromonospora inositola]|uniref:Uncharacterized protein n=1 Tax=Micromonospora inositola TaxID=47865 RepID=A0A1C5H5C0_9ACTN|nr:hypothetical protein [Micromonospora inositola]SCG41093.1 hypothetical protein GA0070613_0840 [Micromonospora inositola]